MRTNLLLCLFLTSFLIQCARNREKPPSDQEIKNTEEALIGANQMMVRNDSARIALYKKERHLALQQTASGLWYEITRHGNGKKVQNNMLVTLAYEVSLLDGTSCYSSDNLGLKQFRVGQGGVESGLEEGVLMLNEGSRALFILPPHLAHGFTGDGNKIPKRAVIVYNIELKKVEP